MKPMSDSETEAIASAFSPCCEFMLTHEQAEQLPDAEPGKLLIGSIQRHCWPHPMAGEFFFRGRWVTGSEAERMRRAARKLSPRTKKTK